MQLFLMRHGIAEPFGLREDSQRALTETGRLRVQAQFQAQAEALSGVSKIVHSPYLRAVETAQIGAEILGISGMVSDERLTPEADPRDALALLEADAADTVLYVTHNPFVGRLIGLLCEGDSRWMEPMDTGMLALLEADWPASAMATLNWKVAAPR